MLRFGVLGPLEVIGDGGVALDVGGRQPRTGFEASVALHLTEHGAMAEAERLVSGARAELERYGER